jgi:hypothetical protein
MDDDIDHCLRWKNWLSAATLQEVLNIFGPLVLLNVFYLKIIRYFIHESLTFGSTAFTQCASAVASRFN